MRHSIEITVSTVSQDNNSLLAGPQNPDGPAVNKKAASFWATGANMEDVIAEVRAKIVAYLDSDALKIGSESRSNLVPVPGRGPERTQ